ncbi:hypothetical protein [Flavobacterium sp.]|uniref:hypothetical protein n=1 Tax=Flavobacterium sp. TaxID=239 RepID=UPI003F69979C
MINSLTTNKEFHIINEFSHIKSIDNNHLKNSFFVVTDDDDNYKGLLSKVDLMLKPHFIVGDCISKRPRIENTASLEDILNVFNENRFDEYPVFEKGVFKGVSCPEKS